MSLSMLVTLQKNQGIDIISFEALQNSTPFQLDSIDQGKYVFSIDNLSTQNTDLTIKGKDIDLDSMVYITE